MLLHRIDKVKAVAQMVARNLSIFFLPRVKITGISFGNYDSRYMIYKTIMEIYIPISDLISKDLSGNTVVIKDSTHYKQALVLKNNNFMDISKDYAAEFMQRYPELNLAQEIYNFKEIFHYVFKNADDQQILVRKSTVFSHKFEVIDGMHRASILLVLGRTRIKCLVTR